MIKMLGNNVLLEVIEVTTNKNSNSLIYVPPTDTTYDYVVKALGDKVSFPLCVGDTVVVPRYPIQVIEGKNYVILSEDKIQGITYQELEI